MKWNFKNGRDVLIFLIFTFLTLNVVATVSNAASNPHSHNEITEAATQFALKTHSDAVKVDVSVNAIDRRLQLPQCDSQLDVFWPPGSIKFGRSTIGIECSGLHSWKIYVRATIDVYEYIAVLSEPVNNGDLVSSDNVQLELASLSTTRGDRLTKVEPLVNHRFKRRYPSGRPLTLSMIAPPRLVKKGTNVIIRSRSSVLKVQMKGVALQDGEKGSMINVRNTSSRRVIQGEVVAKGIIQIIQ